MVGIGLLQYVLHLSVKVIKVLTSQIFCFCDGVNSISNIKKIQNHPIYSGYNMHSIHT